MKTVIGKVYYYTLYSGHQGFIYPELLNTEKRPLEYRWKIDLSAPQLPSDFKSKKEAEEMRHN